MLSSPETIDVQSVLSHLVIEDAFGRAEQARGLCAVAPRCFQRVKHQVSFVGGNRFAKERRVKVPEACAVWRVGGR